MKFRNWLQLYETQQVQRDAEILKVEMRNLLDNELLQAVRRGDNAAMGELLSRWEPKLYGYVKRRTKNEHDAQEIVQDAMLNMLTALRKGTTPERFDSWAYTIARNATASYFRGRKMLTTDDPEGLEALQGGARTGTTGAVIDNIESPDDPVSLISSKEEEECVRQALEDLAANSPNGKRDVQIVYDFYWNKIKVVDIAKQYGEPVGTIKRILHVVRRRLGKCLAGQIGDD
jgi:RNA polymerase sigma factor (sigma-70 family)